MRSGEVRKRQVRRLADAGVVGVAGESEDGDVHVDGFTGGGGSVVGEGVEGEVDFAVGGEVVAGGDVARAEEEAIGGDAQGGEAVAEGGSEGGVDEGGAFEQEAGVGDVAEDVGPEGDHLRGDFAEVVEGAEGEGVVAGDRRQGSTGTSRTGR